VKMVAQRFFGAATVLIFACAAAACGSRAPDSVYIKASNPRADALFGTVVALSSDGSTLAIGAPGDSSSATGIDGDQADHSAYGAGAVYVFSRDNGTWSQQAYVKASNTHAFDSFGKALALSADGSTLVVGADHERSGARGIDGDQSDRSANEAGAVYVFSRAGGTWSQQADLKASNPQAFDGFGRSVALSADGDMLAVGATGEDSGAAGVNGNQTDESIEGSGAVYLFARAGGTWSQQAYVKASNPGLSDAFGRVALSGDGTTLAVGALTETGAVYVYARAGDTWSQQAYVKASNAEAGDRFGYSVALSSDGSTMAVGAEGEASSATGVGGDQADNGAPAAGAVYIFSRAGAVWSQQAYVKASNAGESDWFEMVALSSDGATLAVGAPGEDSGATGIGGNQADNSVTDSGAVYTFTRAGGAWSQKDYLKASNTRVAFESMCRIYKPGASCVGLPAIFGTGVALSGDASTLAAGAIGDVSGATGVNGNQSDTSAVDSAGAVYVF